MAKRKKRLSVDRAEQLEVVKSPVALDIIQYLRQCGPASVAEMGKGIGRKSNSLHYHIKKLSGAGFVHQVSSRQSGARTEAIFDVTAERFRGSNIRQNPILRRLTCEAAAALMRLAQRDFARASEFPDQLCDSGRRRNVVADRFACRLQASELAKINQHIEAIKTVFTENLGSEAGQLCAFTMVLTPLEDKQT